MSDKKWICNGVEFKVGDKVKIVRKVASHCGNGMGEGVEWENIWEMSMDNYIGEIATIDYIGYAGVSFEEGGYGWPLSALEKVAVTLPDGDSVLVDKAGTEYKVECWCGVVELTWMLPNCSDTAYVRYTAQGLKKAIANGFFTVKPSAEKLAKEKALAELVAKQASLINENAKLSAEIASLEKELAQ